MQGTAISIRRRLRGPTAPARRFRAPSSRTSVAVTAEPRRAKRWTGLICLLIFFTTAARARAEPPPEPLPDLAAPHAMSFGTAFGLGMSAALLKSMFHEGSHFAACAAYGGKPVMLTSVASFCDDTGLAVGAHRGI